MRRPRFVTFLAIVDIVSAIIFGALGAGQLSDGIRFDSGFATGVVIVLVAILRAATGVGLWRMRWWARGAELAYNWVKLLAAICGAAYVIKDTDASIIILCVGVAMVAIAILRYFHRREVAELFRDELSDEGRQATLDALRARPSLGRDASLLFGFALTFFALVAIPSLPHGPQNGSKAKRSMADMRSIATALEARATDVNRYNAAGGYSMPPVAIAVEETTPYLVPTYIKTLPTADGWNHPFQIFEDAKFGAKNESKHYAIRSLGKDGKPNAVVAGPTTNWDCDIVYADGQFVSYPEGMGN